MFFLRKLKLPCLAFTLILGTLIGLSTPSYAFFWNKPDEPESISDFSRNVVVGGAIPFSPEDFSHSSDQELQSITIQTLPDASMGTLLMGQNPITTGTFVSYSALSGLSFQSASNTSEGITTFTFLPTFADGSSPYEPVTVTIYVLTQENTPPIAQNMQLQTYKNIAITGYFDVFDLEGDALTFQLVKTPARGSVTLSEDGSGSFVYTPYENKTGKDTFTYSATDSAGNCSTEGTVTIQITKPDTTVTYSDLEGHPIHKAAIHLAEENLLVGTCINDQYFFEPDQTISRAEFLSLAMSATGMEPLNEITMTGFSDDDAIPTWAKGYVSAALKAGVIQGSKNETGAPVFQPDNTITCAEASVILDELLSLSDVPLEVFSVGNSTEHWASQSVANLSASGITSTSGMGDPLTRADAASLLDGTLTLLSQQKSSFFPF